MTLGTLRRALMLRGFTFRDLPNGKILSVECLFCERRFFFGSDATVGLIDERTDAHWIECGAKETANGPR